MFHWYGKQRAKLFVRSMFHVKPAHEVPLGDVMTRHAPLPRVVGAGVIAGISMWSIPLALYLVSLFFNLVFIFLARASYRLPTVLEGVPNVLIGALPYVVVTGVLGAGLAWLRHRSASNKRYFTVMGMRLGLNTIVASVIGLLVSISFYQLIIFFGPFLFFLGFFFDGLWSVFYEWILGWLCGSHKDQLLTMEIQDHLRRHDHLKSYEADQVRVENGRVILTSAGVDTKLRHDIQEALREIEGVTHIVFERVALDTV